jgi:hypothetical protein
MRYYLTRRQTRITEKVISLFILCLNAESDRVPTAKDENQIRNSLWKYSAYMETLVEQEGPKAALKVLKELHLIATKVAFGRPFTALTFRKSRKDNFPRALRPVEDLLRGEPAQKRIGLSITKLYLEIYLPADLDTETITSPCKTDQGK